MREPAARIPSPGSSDKTPRKGLSAASKPEGREFKAGVPFPFSLCRGASRRPVTSSLLPTREQWFRTISWELLFFPHVPIILHTGPFVLGLAREQLYTLRTGLGRRNPASRWDTLELTLNYSTNRSNPYVTWRHSDWFSLGLANTWIKPQNG